MKKIPHFDEKEMKEVLAVVDQCLDQLQKTNPCLLSIETVTKQWNADLWKIRHEIEQYIWSAG